MERSCNTLHVREEWKKPGLMDKWTQPYSGGSINLNTARAVEIGFMVFFWCATMVNVICCLVYVIPEYLSHYNATSRHAFRLVIVFLHAHIITSWFLVRHYESSMKPSQGQQHRMGETSQQNGGEHHLVDIQEKVPSNENWRWKLCDICQLKQPPRAHHCKVCNVCILKRDHHCFMTGVCVGFWNQRHFIILNFYITIASVLGLVYSYQYMTSDLGPEFHNHWDYLMPYIFYKWCTGQIYLQHLLFSFLLYTFSWSCFVPLGFFAIQMYVTTQGKTLHEAKEGIKSPCASSIRKNFRSVFGDYWALNFLFPAHAWFRQPGDGMAYMGVYKES